MKIPATFNWNEVMPWGGAVAQLGDGDFGNFKAAVESAANTAEDLYKAYLLGGELPDGSHLKSPSRAAQTTYHQSAGMLCWAVGNTSEAARWVEEGQEARDMKACLPTAPKARRAKDGHLYLIIPFRNATSDAKVNADGKTATGMRAMPKRIYDMAKNLERSTFVGTVGKRVSATGYLVDKWTYDWNGYVSRKQILEAGLDEATADRYQGMVKMSKLGQTSYVTFRIMSQNSPADSWIRKQVLAIPALSTAIAQATEASEDALAAAFVADVDLLYG